MVKPEQVLIGRPIWSVVDVMPSTYRSAREAGTADWALILTTGGRGLIRHRQASMTVVPGDLVLFRPGQPQDWATAPESKTWSRIWSHFLPRPHWSQLLKWPNAADMPGFIHVDDAETLSAIVDSFTESANRSISRHDPDFDFALNALERVLLLCSECNPDRSQSVDPRLRRCIERISADVGHAWTIALMAEIAGMSAVRFAHLFREQVGETPWRFLERQRMDRARALLAQSLSPINWIAQQVGYADPGHFCRRFRAVMRHSPSAFRERNRNRQP